MRSKLSYRPAFAPELPLAIVYFALAAAAALLTREQGGVPLFWPAEALAAACLMRMARVRWPVVAVLLATGSFLTQRYVGGQDLTFSAGATLVNLAQIAASVLVFRILWPQPFPNLTIRHATWMTLVMGGVITGVAALAGGALLRLTLHAPFLEAARGWWAASALGACLLVPAVVLYSPAGVQRLLRRPWLLRNLLTAVLAVAGCYLAIRYVRFPFVVISLSLLMAAFQVGGFGAAVLGALCGTAVVVLWGLGIHPSGVHVETFFDSPATMPVIALLAAVMPPMAVGLGTDARRRATRALVDSERRFRESMEQSPVGVMTMDMQGRWTFSNTALQRMLGYTHEELAALSHDALAHPDELDDMRRRWRKLLAHEVDSYTATRRFLRSSGDYVWIHAAVSLVRADEGTPLHFIAQIESLEERRLAEARLANERERLRVTIEAISDAVITADGGQRVSFMNQAACRLIGQELEHVSGRRLGEILALTDPDSGEAAEDLAGAALRGGEARRRGEPCILMRPDGGVCYVQESVSPVFDAQGRVDGIVVVLQDAGAQFARTRELHRQATHDGLTGLLNRAAFRDGLQRAFERSRGTGTPAAVIALDLDHFKRVNDTGGHAAGDAVLRHVADVLNRNLRPGDVAARLGGDEFAILLRDCTPAEAEQVGLRLLRALNPLRTPWGAAGFKTGASLGLAPWEPRFAGIADWERAADQAAYESKRAGRGRLQLQA